MKKIASFITKKKIFILIFFLIGTIASGIFIHNVKINYDISKYLNSNCETSIALDITTDQFGANGNMQVMVSNIDEDTANDIKEDIEQVNYVLAVNFDSTSEDYFKDNNALYILIIDGDDYSENAKSVINDIEELLTEYTAYYGGTAVDKKLLQESIESEMVYIIIVAICLAIIILLLTSKSWIEPIILLVVAGIAIVINLGTNAFFPSISYITNSIAAILQLALSIDYSIVLINTYKKNKETMDNNEAMKKAIVQVIKPISASGLTTIAGLCALLFMSYRIGFDIGIVLIKGIIISLITSITLLPGVVLLLDKALEKTKKPSLKLKGNFFAKLTKKGYKFIVPIGIVIIALSAVMNFNNSYTYSNASLVDPIIAETFKENNQFMVIFPNEYSSYDNQEAFINEIKQFKKENGEEAFINYTSYTNTVLEYYDETKIVNKLNVNNADAQLLLTMYNLYQNPDEVTLTFNEFIDFSDYLIANDNDAIEYAGSETKDTIAKILAIKDILNTSNSKQQLYDSLTSPTLSDLSGEVELFSISEIYGYYYYSSIEENSVSFNVMLNFLTYIFENVEQFEGIIDTDTLSSLKLLSTEIEEQISQAETPMTQDMFIGYMYQTYNQVITNEQAAYIYQSYYYSKGEEEKDTIPYLDLLAFLVDTNMISDETAVNEINQAKLQYQTVTNKYPYDQFINVLTNVIYMNTGTIPTLEMTNDDMQMIYIFYFDNLGLFDEVTILGSTFVNYVKSLYENNEYMKTQIGETLYDNICSMNLIDQYLKNETTYNYIDQFDKIDELQNSITVTIDNDEMNVDMVSGVYIKYENYHENNLLSPVQAENLLSFVNENLYTNELLIKKVDDEKLTQINKANEDLATANKLFKGEDYSRIIISMDLEMEGKDTEKFVEYLMDKTQEYFSIEAHVAGEAVSNYDLKESFKTDEIIISIVTIVSILIIVALTFKSASIPLILVVVIQGACYLAFATNFITGSVFFMSYIISSCILMGATIDYGILMCTNYVKNRKTMDKDESLKKAIESSLPTIFTSGLILTVCGFAIALLSTQSTISSVGLLVGKGAVAAILLILFLLPSMIYLLDKVILKTTYRKKEKKKEVEI
ncbi:MAG: efflux RND transporter permease subunit [Bacilli bacterium]